MVTKREQILLDYMYEQAQNLIDFMRRNGYEDYQHTMMTTMLDKDDDKYNLIGVDATQMEHCESVRRVTKQYNMVTGKSNYKEWVKDGRQD